MNFRTHALRYAGFDWYVFPIAPGGKRPPLIEGGVNSASNNPAIIDHWAQTWPNANVGLALGKSGLVAVDLDIKFNPQTGEFAYDWRPTLAAWERDGKRFPEVPRVRSRGGERFHLYFRAPKGFSSLSHELKKFANRGVDVRTGNMYTVLPPSEAWADKMEDGIAGVYRWEVAPLGPALPEPPKWLLDQLRRPPPPKYKARAAVPNGLVGYVAALHKVATAEKGTGPKTGRNHELNKQAHLIGRLYEAT